LLSRRGGDERDVLARPIRVDASFEFELNPVRDIEESIVI